MGPDDQLLNIFRAAIQQLADRAGASRADSWATLRERAAPLNVPSDRTEHQFPMRSAWSQCLFLALLKVYGVPAYRYKGQKRTTVMAKVSAAFVEELLWPQYIELVNLLQGYFDATAYQVISQAITPGPYHVSLLAKRNQSALCPDCARKEAEAADRAADALLNDLLARADQDASSQSIVGQNPRRIPR